MKIRCVNNNRSRKSSILVARKVLSSFQIRDRVVGSLILGGARMFRHGFHQPLLGKLGVGAAAALLCASIAEAQLPPASGTRVIAEELMRRDLIGAPGKEVVVSTIEVPPGVNSEPHRHNAQVFVYVLQGKMVMQVKGGPRVTLGPGQTFYENPSDIHALSANASKTERAKFLALFIKDKDKPGSIPVTPDQAQLPASVAGDQTEAPPSAAPPSQGGALMQRDLIALPGKEVVMSRIEQAPGATGQPHRHFSQVFVYVLQGNAVMQVKGGPRMTLGPGQTFYEDPSDIHSVSANASKTEPAAFLAFLIKDKDRPGTIPVTQEQAQ
jgi:quercetin dioxygenase-like cupin family protein